MRPFLRPFVLICAFATVATTVPGEVPCCGLRYVVRPDPASGVIDVGLEIRGFGPDSLVLIRPSSRPLPGLLAEDPRVDGERPSRWEVVEGSPRWIYAPPPGGWGPTIRVHYRLAITAERPINAWAVGFDDDLLYAPAEAIFLVPGMADLAAHHSAVRVEWDLPRGWQVFTGWQRNAFRGTRTLIKTNILAGEIERHRIAACGLEVELGVHGKWQFSPEELGHDLGRLACAAHRRLGEPDVDHFAVSLVQARFPMTSGNRNGPHAIAFVHSIPGGDRPSTRLLAHELVHLWQRFDSPTWFQEGVNDYMALRLAHEAGLYDDDAYTRQLGMVDSVYRVHPHRHKRSFADEAAEAKPYGPSDEYLAYRKGAIVGLALDRELRLRTGGRIDLAILWRDMNARARFGKVLWGDDDIETRAAALAEGSMAHFFGQWVAGRTMLPRPETLLANLPPPPSTVVSASSVSTLAAFLQTAFGRISR